MNEKYYEYKHDAQASEPQRVKRHTRLRVVLVFVPRVQPRASLLHFGDS